MSELSRADHLRAGDRFVLDGEIDEEARVVTKVTPRFADLPWPERVIDVDWEANDERPASGGRFEPSAIVTVISRKSEDVRSPDAT